MIKITVLGSGTCAVTTRRSCASYLLQLGKKQILLDIGFGALRRLVEAGFDYRNIDGVICSHFHLDHIGDLLPLIMALQFTPNYKRSKSLNVIGPQQFRTFLHHCRDLHGEWVIPADGFELLIHELHSEQLEIFSGLITARTTRHTLYTNAYRIEYAGKSLFYSGDTGPCEDLIDLAADADLAIIEASFPDEESFKYHLTPKEAGSLARQAHVKQLVLTHFYPMMDQIDVVAACSEEYKGVINIAEDFDTFTL